MDIVKELLFVLFALGFILALAWYSLRALKHFKTVNTTGHNVQILAVKPIGQRDRIVIIEYRDSEYVLAVSPGAVEVVDKLPAGEKNHKQ